jgi:hypothetical protein
MVNGSWQDFGTNRRNLGQSNNAYSALSQRPELVTRQISDRELWREIVNVRE